MKTKDKVLTFLEERRGSFISGETIAQKLQLSRNAVWKAIKQLEEDGYHIEAIRNKGYSLSKESKQMSSVGVRGQLAKDYVDMPIYYFSTIESTNKKAKELAIIGENHGTLVLSNEQTAGKGRYGRTFESPKDSGIYMSIILNPDNMVFNDPTLITSYAAVVVANTIKKVTGKKMGIKWVNDLFFNSKKVCGILTEAVTNFENGQIEWIVLGIGINLSTSRENFSKEVSKTAGAILTQDEKKINRNELVAKIYEDIMTYQMKKNQIEIMDEYKELSIVLQKKVALRQGNNEFVAIVKDIDCNGRLLIELENGKLEMFNSGEISIILN